MGRLDGKTAVITGAARGTGAETARLFAAEGATVIVADVLDDLGEGVAADLGGAARYVHLDVTSEDAWANTDLGNLDVLVNNAAVLDVASIADTTADSLSRILDVNLKGAFFGIRAAIEPMRRRGGGSIVNVASIDAMEGYNGVAAYTASKWGMRGLTKAAAIELGSLGIRVNTVCPGFGSQEMVQPFYEAAIDRLKERTEPLPPRPPKPLARKGSLADVAQAILYLASDEGAFVTGVDLPVDGGFTVGKIEPGAPFS
jgi:3alpha(or 20beta)-hydroxysteroid dehydrogenase